MTAEEKKIRVKLKKIQNTIQALREESLRLLEVNASILPKDYTPDSLSEWRKRKSENQKVIDNNNESISDLQQMMIAIDPESITKEISSCEDVAYWLHEGKSYKYPNPVSTSDEAQDYVIWYWETLQVLPLSMLFHEVPDLSSFHEIERILCAIDALECDPKGRDRIEKAAMDKLNYDDTRQKTRASKFRYLQAIANVIDGISKGKKL